MHRFKVGQKVVAIYDHELGQFKRGDVFTVEQLFCCSKCGQPGIFLEELTRIVNTECLDCGSKFDNTRQRYKERRFAPLQSTTDAIEYKMKVSIPELTKIEEYQQQ